MVNTIANFFDLNIISLVVLPLIVSEVPLTPVLYALLEPLPNLKVSQVILGDIHLTLAIGRKAAIKIAFPHRIREIGLEIRFRYLILTIIVYSPSSK